MRDTNKVIKRSYFPIPTVQELRHTLNKAVRVIKLDLNHAFHEMPLSKESRHLTNFRTHCEIYRFKTLDKEFDDKLRKKCVICQVTLISKMTSSCLETFKMTIDKNLGAMRQRLSDKGFSLCNDKCEWNQTQGLYFGYVFSKKVRSADPDKIEAIINTLSPKSVSEV